MDEGSELTGIGNNILEVIGIIISKFGGYNKRKI